MERRLYDAARDSDITMLLNLLSEDPLALERSCVFGAYAETPLRIATMLGHMNFVREILNRKPSLASKVDLQKSTPLHLAAATNNVEMVALLFNANPDMCLARDQYGRNPLYLAGINGQIDVLKWLMQVKRDAAWMMTDERDSILHLCVKFNQLEAMKVLVDDMGDNAFVNSVDCNGNTKLHLAVLERKFEVVNFLLQRTNINVNSENLYHQTALDILYMKHGDTIEGTLLRAGALRSNIFPSNSISPSQHSKEHKELERERILNNIRKPGMVAASVIAAAAFQAGINPPGGVWQENSNNHTAGFSVLASENMHLYDTFLILNTVALLSSVTIFVMLLANLPFRKSRPLISALIFLTIFAVNSFPFSYATSMIAMSPPHYLSYNLYYVVGVMSFIWGFMFLWRPLSQSF